MLIEITNKTGDEVFPVDIDFPPALEPWAHAWGYSVTDGRKAFIRLLAHVAAAERGEEPASDPFDFAEDVKEGARLGNWNQVLLDLIGVAVDRGLVQEVTPTDLLIDAVKDLTKAVAKPPMRKVVKTRKGGVTVFTAEP